jgi:photosystem II stability/assembly factor-like uncharacterized protein
VLSIGKGNESRIYKTTDAGKNWLLEYTEQNPKAFLDCMAFWDATHGIVVGDPLDGKPELLTTSDSGAHWTPLQSNTTPPAKNGEGSPAIGTCIATYTEEKGRKGNWQAWFVTENASRVFHTDDSGKTWTASETPLVIGLNQGVFSIAVVDADRLVIVGGETTITRTWRSQIPPTVTTAARLGKRAATVPRDTAGVSRLCRTRPVPPCSRLDQPEQTTRLIEERTGSR